MAGRWFHPEGEIAIGALLEHFKVNPGSEVTVTYETGESYKRKFYSSYEADNEDELEEGVAVVPVDYFAVALDPVEVIVPGGHYGGPGSLIELSYRDFPERIVAEDGTVVYQADE